jgi:hypothetical protein
MPASKNSTSITNKKTQFKTPISNVHLFDSVNEFIIPKNDSILLSTAYNKFGVPLECRTHNTYIFVLDMIYFYDSFQTLLSH